MSQMLPDINNPTPMILLSKLPKEFKHTKFYGKMEWYNPFGSVKDRIASNMVFDAVAQKYINNKTTNLVEPTSGNTGLGLAMIAN